MIRICDNRNLDSKVKDFSKALDTAIVNLDRIWDAADMGDFEKVKTLSDSIKIFGSDNFSEIRCALHGICSDYLRMKEENERLLSESKNLAEYDALLKKFESIRKIVE